MYWLVGAIEGQPEGKGRPKADMRSGTSGGTDQGSAPSSSSRSSGSSALPSYSRAASDTSGVEWLRGSIHSERRIAISHNPNPEGGVTRLDDDFTHNLPGFGTCRIQTRVNEVSKHRMRRADDRSGVWVASFHCASHASLSLHSRHCSRFG